MKYRLEKLAAGAYDVVLAREVVASLVKVPCSQSAHWVLELLDETTLPAPFTEAEHRFETLEQAKRFLGIGTGSPRGAVRAGLPGGIELGEAA